MPDLNCIEFEQRLLEAVENRESPGDPSEGARPAESSRWRALRQRAKTCPHCGRLWNQFALLDRVLPLWKEQIPAVNLAEAVLARWQAEGRLEDPLPTTNEPKKHAKPPKKNNVFSAGPIRAMLTAAAAIALVCFFWVFRPTPEPELPPSSFVSTTSTDFQLADESTSSHLPKPQTEIAVAVVPRETNWNEAAQDAQAAYWLLASDTAEAFASASVLVPVPTSSPATPAVSKPPARSTWVQGLGAGLKPIGQDVSQAMSFLLEAIPEESPTL